MFGGAQNYKLDDSKQKACPLVQDKRIVGLNINIR